MNDKEVMSQTEVSNRNYEEMSSTEIVEMLYNEKKK